MGRIIVNKHFDEKSSITSGSIVYKGEIIISNEVGFEGIFIKNNDGNLVFIAPLPDGLASESFVIEKIAEAKLEGEDVDLSIFVTEDELNEKGFLTEIPEDSIREIALEEVLKIVDSADTSFDTLREIAEWITNDTTGAASMANDIQTLKAQLNALTLGAKASASVSKSIIYVGEENSITVTGRMEPNTLTPCTVSIYKGSDLMASADTSVVSYTELVSGTTSYNIKAVYNGTTYTASTRVSAYYPTYYGFGVEYNDVLSNKNLLSSAKRTYTDTANADGVYYYILVPDGVSKPSSFTMGGATFNMGSTNETINGVNYTVFKSGSIFNNGGEVNIIAT